MRICFVSPGVLYTRDRKFHQQGSESVILGISRQLVKMGHEVYITGRFNEFKDNQKEIEGIHFLNIKSHEFLETVNWMRLVQHFYIQKKFLI